jgi:hypothetical protein
MSHDRIRKLNILFFIGSYGPAKDGFHLDFQLGRIEDGLQNFPYGSPSKFIKKGYFETFIPKYAP